MLFIDDGYFLSATNRDEIRGYGIVEGVAITALKILSNALLKKKESSNFPQKNKDQLELFKGYVSA